MEQTLGKAGFIIYKALTQKFLELDAREEESIRRTNSLEIDHGLRKRSRGSGADDEEEDEADDGQEMVPEEEYDAAYVQQQAKRMSCRWYNKKRMSNSSEEGEAEDEEDDEQEDEMSMVQFEVDEDEDPCSVKEGGAGGEGRSRRLRRRGCNRCRGGCGNRGQGNHPLPQVLLPGGQECLALLAPMLVEQHGLLALRHLQLALLESFQCQVSLPNEVLRLLRHLLDRTP